MSDESTRALPPPPPRTLGGFRLGEVIGKGGMGRVYRAVAPDGRIVAIKEMAGLTAKPELTARFLREARIRIDHPNIIEVIDAGEDEGKLFIALELLEGETLSQRVRAKGPLSAEAVVEVARQICAGLQAAHARRVIHRDLKPSNIFLCSDGTVKLLDFGIAHVETEGTQLTIDGSILGTPGYLSPEQARGDRSADERTDVWGVGAILYMTLSGRAPFARDNAMAGMLAVILDEPAPLDDLTAQGTEATMATSAAGSAMQLPEAQALGAAAAPPQLWSVVARCLEKRPEDRWASVEALQEALERADLSEVAEPGSGAVRAMPSAESRVVTLLLAEEISRPAGLQEAIDRYGGIHLSVRGGHVIGLFGARSTEGDEAARAVEAAFRARDSAGFLAVAGGRATRSGQVVSGEAVATAERGCALGASGVVVDEIAARLLQDRYRLEARGEHFFEVHPAKGSAWSEPSLLEPPTLSSRPSPDAEKPLLGREAEVVQLRVGRDAVVEEEQAWLGLLVGPIGVGKTRLRLAAEQLLEEAEFTVLVAGGESHRREVDLGLWTTLLRGHFQSEDLGRKVREVIEDADTATEFVETFERLLGGSSAGRWSTGADPQVAADRSRVAVVEYLSARAEEGPVALIADDLQWADDASLSLLEEVLDELEELPLFVLATSRPELFDRRTELFSGRDLQRIELKGLRAQEVGQLASQIAGRTLPEEAITTIADRTGGNPFYVEQIVHDLIEGGRIEGDLSKLPIPVTIEAAVQSRLDHLPPREKDLCKRAATFGRSFTAAGLMALGEADPGQVLSSLKRRGVVSRARGRGKKAHQFRNALLAEVAYAMNSPERRVELHRRVADFLSDWPDADDAEVARHYELGDRPAQAAEHYHLAATEASRRGDTSSILRCTERALALKIPTEAHFDLYFLRADALSFLGDRDAQGEALRMALTHAATEDQRAAVLTGQIERLASLGELEEARTTAVEAVAAARKGKDADLLARALARATLVLIYSGELDEAGVHIAEARELLPRVSPRTEALVAAWRAQLATARGDLGERRAAFGDAIEGYRACGDRRRLSGVEVNLADTFNRVAAWGEAEEALREALLACRKVGYRTMEGYALANLGYALVGQGRMDEALEAYAEAETIAREGKDYVLDLAVRLYRARALFIRGENVRTEAAEITEAALEQGIKAMAAGALAVGTDAALAEGEPEAALRLAEQAMALRNELGSLEEDEATVFLALVSALQANGRGEEAKRVLADARARLIELADRIQDPDWRQRFLDDVESHRVIGSLVI